MGRDDFADAMGYGSFIWAASEEEAGELTAEQVLRAKRALADAIAGGVWRAFMDDGVGPAYAPSCPLFVSSVRDDCRMVMLVSLRCRKCGFGGQASITEAEMVDRVDVTPTELALRAGVEPCDDAIKGLELRRGYGGAWGRP